MADEVHARSGVQVFHLPDGSIAVTDGRQDGPVLTYTRQEWEAFIAGVRGGEFDLSVLAETA